MQDTDRTSHKVGILSVAHQLIDCITHICQQNSRERRSGHVTTCYDKERVGSSQVECKIGPKVSLLHVCHAVDIHTLFNLVAGEL